LAGLDPEQIAQIRAYEIAGEKARQAPISAMIEAQLGFGREDLDVQRLNLLKAQEARTAQLAPAEFALKTAQARGAQQAERLHAFQLEQAQSLSGLAREQAMAELAGTRQRTATSAQQAALDAERLQQARALGPAELAKAQADIRYRDKATEEIGLARVDRNTQFNKQNVPVLFPTGKDAEGNITYGEYVVSADKLSDVMAKGGVIDKDKAFQQEHQLRQEGRAVEADAEKRRQLAKEHEANILGTNARGVPNINNPAVVTSMDEFNRLADEPYFYEYSAKTPYIGGLPIVSNFTGASANKIPLANATGRPLKARLVYEAWKKFQLMPDEPGGIKHGNVSLADYARFLREGK
jgi:hypothetical protein